MSPRKLLDPLGKRLHMPNKKNILAVTTLQVYKSPFAFGAHGHLVSWTRTIVFKLLWRSTWGYKLSHCKCQDWKWSVTSLSKRPDLPLKSLPRWGISTQPVMSISPINEFSKAWYALNPPGRARWWFRAKQEFGKGQQKIYSAQMRFAFLQVAFEPPKWGSKRSGSQNELCIELLSAGKRGRNDIQERSVWETTGRVRRHEAWMYTQRKAASCSLKSP